MTGASADSGFFDLSANESSQENLNLEFLEEDERDNMPVPGLPLLKRCSSH